MKISVMGVLFDNLSPVQFIDEALLYIDRKERCPVATPNAEIGLLCKKDTEYKDMINRCALVLPDGVSIKIAAKILGLPITHKAAGVEFCEGMCKALSQRGGRVFLFGAKPKVAERAGAKLQEKYPGLVIAGARDGYFDKSEEESIAKQIKDALPDLVLVCLGAPKQERFIFEHLEKLPACVIVGAGGSIDVFAGNAKRAPKFFIKTGTEWLYRLICEPKRIKRMIKLPVYLWDAFVYKMRGDKKDA